MALPDAKVTIAERVAAGAFIAPPRLRRAARAGRLQPLPAFCRVAATAAPTPDSAIKIEVWLPVEGWNGKFVAVGNGGFSGEIFYFAMAEPLRRGYAVAGTDTGHEGGQADASFAVGHPEKLVDFAWRAVHEMTVKSKAIVAAHYSQPRSRSYWVGCSSGGRQGLKEAQRFPDDYDGISAGAPANNWVPLMAYAAQVQRLVTDPEGRARAAAAHAAQRGRHRGVRRARRRHRSRRRGPAQLHVRSRHARVQGRQFVDLPDAAAGRDRALDLRRRRESAHRRKDLPGSRAGRRAPVVRVYTDRVPDRRELLARPGHGRSELEPRDPRPRRGRCAREIAGHRRGHDDDPNLTDFFARGGKLLLWHGWTDGLIPAQNTIDYYESVLAATGAERPMTRCGCSWCPAWTTAPAAKARS